MNPVLASVTARIQERSVDSRAAYLQRIEAAAARKQGPARQALSCGNLAHGIAGCGAGDKAALTGATTANIGIVSAYNDMLSAHQPFERFPDLIRAAAHEVGAVAQFAGGVPAMCDGVTQGQAGMELSLFSRDVIALSTAVALSHDMFDAAICLGVCDKIVPGLLIGALSFGHLPVVFAPAGPMPSGLPNKEKARVREAYASGKASRAELLAAESASYHSPGTCTFYGTANSNQMLMEFMGLQLPGGSFVNPGTPLRDALTRAAVRTVLGLDGGSRTPIGQIVDAKAIVNAIVGLLATGGSTNHTIHLVAIAAAAGIRIDWDDFSELSSVVPLLARVYPNGSADVNHFHAAGGLGFTLRSLLDAGLLHADVNTILGPGLERFLIEPKMAEPQMAEPQLPGLHTDGSHPDGRFQADGADGNVGRGALDWKPAAAASLDTKVLRGTDSPFDAEGGIRLVQGNLGRAIVKVSAVPAECRAIEAPARVFDSQQAFVDAFNRGEFKSDMVAVITHQGASSNGMPELHKLTPFLKVLQDSGLKVALLTDGRMSGASGAVLAAIHVTPDTLASGVIGRLRDGDMVCIDAPKGVLKARVDAAVLAARPAPDPAPESHGVGQELFAMFRRQAGLTEAGASIFFD